MKTVNLFVCLITVLIIFLAILLTTFILYAVLGVLHFPPFNCITKFRIIRGFNVGEFVLLLLLNFHFDKAGRHSTGNSYIV